MKYKKKSQSFKKNKNSKKNSIRFKNNPKKRKLAKKEEDKGKTLTYKNKKSKGEKERIKGKENRKNRKKDQRYGEKIKEGGEQRTGRVKRHSDGFGFLIPDDQFKEDIYLPKKQMKGIMGNDRIKVLVKKRKQGNYFYAQVLEILERNTQSISGSIQKVNKNLAYLLDYSRSWGEHLTINHLPEDIKETDWVLADILTYPGSKEGFTGQIKKVIKNFKSSSMDIMRVLYTQNIPHEFDTSAVEEANQFLSEIKKEDLLNRKDLRHLDFITIDGINAQDFDDAIYVQAKEKKGEIPFKVYIAIADVSHYVKPGSALDLEAYKRGNSTYLPRFVVPMLPEKLSNDLCSLSPNKDRLAFVMEADLEARGKVIKTQFYEAVIQSKARLTYGEVQEVIDQGGEKNPQGKPFQKIVPSNIEKVILNAEFLASLLMEERTLRGALSLDISETEVEIDESGEPLDVVKTKRLFSHCLIEELMVLTNREVARYLNKKRIFFLSRVHESPNLEGIENLDFFLKAFGFPKGLKKVSTLGKNLSELREGEKKGRRGGKLKREKEEWKEKKEWKKENQKRKEQNQREQKKIFNSSGDLQKSINKAISYFSKTPRSSIFSLLVLRSLPQAKYDVDYIGHFGLSLKHYTHFTSPIRRYSDLIVHRTLKKALLKDFKQLNSDSKKEVFFKSSEIFVEDLKSKGVHLSACEQRSIKAERQVLSIKKARFLEKHLGKCFEGMISSVKKFGIFVVLKDFDIDGLIHIENLKGGYLDYDEREMKLYSRKTGITYTIGDFLQVQVAKVNVEDGKVSFLLAENS